MNKSDGTGVWCGVESQDSREKEISWAWRKQEDTGEEEVQEATGEVKMSIQPIITGLRCFWGLLIYSLGLTVHFHRSLTIQMVL